MREIIFNSEKNKIHLVGIGGISMSGLAEYLVLKGFTVSGSDLSFNERLERLKKLGVKVFDKHSANNVKGAAAVIFTSAVREDNPELVYAKRKKIPVYSRSQVLGAILNGFNKTIAVSGSHGKTTATSMIAHTLICANVKPTVFLGGESALFGNFLNGDKKFAVAEACEFRKNFLDIKPNLAVVLNIDNDHLDSYGNMENMVDAFSQFVSGSVAFINADDERSKQIHHATTLTFGIENLAHYSARNLRALNRGYSFTAYAYGLPLGKIELSVLGKHNVYNALATIAVCDYLRIPFCYIKRALESFTGVKRRLEYLGKLHKLDCYADYAHHPKEICATIEGFRQSGKSFAVVFQPHTYSRTKLLMQDFIGVLSVIPDIVIYQTYPAREIFDADGSAYALYQNLNALSVNDVRYADNPEKLALIIRGLQNKYQAVLFLGAGDIYDTAKSLLEK